MKKIVVTNEMGLSPSQKTRLEKFGEVKYYDDRPKTAEEWLDRCLDFDIICSWMNGLREKYGEVKNAFISVPFVGVGSFADPKILKANNTILCNSPGSNSNAVCEWIIYMILTTMRQLKQHINTNNNVSIPLTPASIGLKNKNITILGKGHIGTKVGKICDALEMNVTYFNRGDSLVNSIKNADVIVDVLSSNPSTVGLLDKIFFESIKMGSIFISVTVDTIVDFNAMLAALDKGQLAYVAHDVMNAKLGDISNELYQKLISHPRVYATPHISAFNDVTTQVGNDMMIDNIEAYLKGKPINVFK